MFPIQADKYEIPTARATSWQNVYENRAGIPYQAWSAVSKNVVSNLSKVGNVELIIGPNTKLNFADLKLRMDQVSKAIPDARNVKNLKVFVFNFKDSAWADETFKRLYANETTDFKNRHARAVTEICPVKREVCFAQAFVDSNLDGIIMWGITDPGSKEQINQTYSEYSRDVLAIGMGHEYLHTIQRVILGERWFQRDYTPPSWFNEGSAVFMENAASNHDSFDTFMQFRDVDSKLLYADCPYEFCVKIDEAKVLNYLSLSHRQGNWDNFPYAMKYEMSARTIEVLVALKGPDSIIDLVEVMSTQKTFDRAFEEVYGISYESAKPIIAKIVAEQFALRQKSSSNVNATPTPTPTSFDNLFEARKGISLAAWNKVSETVKVSKSKVGTLDIYTGPNTKPHFDNYPLAVELVSRAFPNKQEPAKTIVVRFEYQDVAWAEATLKQKISSSDYQQIDANSGNKLFISPCDAVTKNCRGASQQTTPSGISVIIQGVDTQINSYDPTANARFFTGMLEAHEYFHALQRIPIMGKTNVWPHAWFREGGAEWAQNVVINHQDFDSYAKYMKANCSQACIKLSESEIAEFLTTANDNYLPSKFEPWLNYSLGSWIMESLVALKGQDVMIDMYAEMGKRLTFDQAFKNLFGVEWSYAIPILAKTIYANLRGN